MKIAAVLADGFEEIEAITIIDILRRGGIEVELWGLNKLQVTGGHNVVISADKLFDHRNDHDLDGLFLPGGKSGVENLIKSSPFLDLIKKMNNQQKWLVAICAAPYVLEKAGVLRNKLATLYPSWTSKIESAKEILTQPVVVDENIITSQGVGTSLELALTLCKIWVGDDLAEQLASAILYHKR